MTNYVRAPKPNNKEEILQQARLTDEDYKWIDNNLDGGINAPQNIAQYAILKAYDIIDKNARRELREEIYKILDDYSIDGDKKLARIWQALKQGELDG